MKSVFTLAAALGALIPFTAQAQQAIPLAPTGEWEVGSGDESCWISRQFGTQDKGVYFRLETFSPALGNYRVFMRGKALPQRDSGVLEFEYAFTPDAGRIPESGVMARSGNISTLNFSTSLRTSDQVAAKKWDPLPPARDAEIRELVLQFSRGDPVALQLGSLSGPMAQLRECASGLPGKWGLDAEQQRTLSRRPTTIEGSFQVDSATFPWEYLRTGQSVTIYLRMMVDTGGVPRSCVVQSPRLETAAYDIACQTLMQMRFEPALDASGEPVDSFHATSIFYMTPRRNGNN